MLDLRLQFETIRDLRVEIVRNIAETKRRLLDVETRQSETVREVVDHLFYTISVFQLLHFHALVPNLFNMDQTHFGSLAV